MSLQDERELRERLDCLLGDLAPRPAPVLAAMRHGRRIRVRRWIAVAAGVAIVGGGVALLPAVLHADRAVPTPAAPIHYTVTVNAPGPGAPAGLIASGTQDGYRWTVRVLREGRYIVVGGIGVSGIGGLPTNAGAVIDMESAGIGGKGGNVMFVGAVRSDVTTVAVALPGGKVLALTPVGYRGHRYVAIVIPYGVPIVRAVAYDGQRELAYSVPYDRTSLIAWWAPGQVGPARFSETIGAGVTDGHPWRFSAQYGPWGYCYASPNGNDCTGTRPMRSGGGTAIGSMMCGGLPYGNSSGPIVGLDTAGSDVRAVTIQLAGRTSERFPVVDVRGTRLFAYAVPSGQRVVGSTEYGAAGQVVAHDPPAGALDICQ